MKKLLDFNSISIRQVPPVKAVAKKKAAPVKAVKNGKAAAKQESEDKELGKQMAFQGSLSAAFLI